jgi:hypothetical protein
MCLLGSLPYVVGGRTGAMGHGRQGGRWLPVPCIAGISPVLAPPVAEADAPAMLWSAPLTPTPTRIRVRVARWMVRMVVVIAVFLSVCSDDLFSGFTLWGAHG